MRQKERDASDSRREEGTCAGVNISAHEASLRGGLSPRSNVRDLRESNHGAMQSRNELLQNNSGFRGAHLSYVGRANDLAMQRPNCISGLHRHRVPAQMVLTESELVFSRALEGCVVRDVASMPAEN